ncbi:hypothetical protein B5E53_02350 [Eubacterium sp. An11]|uniref:hypothetical protein n=1 Tax=Eubacterium sp. An11 TaxID=1965542 RepID=UPI000B37B289|nr:hypothetical protein [Eubacterium sp. An11]OUQ69602.1 hypothetical protein B5E53_02350 [Eubacterium sp. An11]
MKSENIICAEMLLAKYFSDGRKEGLAQEIIAYVKSQMKGSGVRRSDIREARKNLGITSHHRGDVYVWSWSDSKSPDDVWCEKSGELMRCGKKR